ncbi:Rrf2 family transcriptional regulator [Spirochaeta isovalerica]|uniref:Rrf2 family protein n=1 Tax=Spirochaeta isovalerica TaxID=150 RepID=A0A841REF9_9SPIO|nr:Rrf2 family protein [Spirochaeta isovalerica]
MKITYKGDYSLKVILELACHYPDKLIHIEDIANRQDIPRKFLEQILLNLKRGGFLVSRKGARGGYALARPPREITLGEVVRYIEGSVYPISCIDCEAPSPCNELSTCIFAPVWRSVGDAISSIIDSVDFEKLKEDYLLKKNGYIPDYQI